MFTINGKNIKISSNDTLDNLKDKISVSLGTLPSLLGDIPNNIVDKGTYTIEDPIFYIQDQIVYIRKRNNEPILWNEIFNNYNDEIDQEFLKKLYIVSKIQSSIDDFGMGNENQALQYALFELQNELGDINESIWTNRNNIIKDFQNMVKEKMENVKKSNKTLSAWETIQPTFKSTNFVINKINHQTEIPNLNKHNEIMVFDSIKINDIVVACFYQDMVKYNPNYKHLINGYLNQDWMLTSKIKASDIIRIMINYTAPNSRTKYKMINVFVREATITFNIETPISEFNEQKNITNLKNLIKNIIQDMGKKEAYKKSQEKEFYYGSYSSSINISLVVLKDLITNDNNVYTISYINESTLINTRKTNLNIFLKGNRTTEDVGVSLFERPDTVGTFIRLKKIRGGSDLKERINLNMLLISKILQYTLNKIDSILNFYQQYISLNVEVNLFEGQISKDKLTVKNQVPEIFVSNYTRLCNKPPIIVENVDESDDTVLKFPIYGESEPKLYICPYSDYKYPGLRENTKLINKDIFPFVPCCYQRPQNQRKNYKMYYNQENYEQRINTGEIGKSLKILAPERLGTLPPKIDKLLNYKTNIKFYRYGTPTSPSSCLNILNKVTNNKNSEQFIRRELAKRAELCKGECVSLSIKEIAEKLLDLKTYINPRYFKGALTDYYNLSYILFSKDKDDFSVYPNKFIRFICPLKQKVILLIEHEEAEHVELVVDEETSTYVNKQGKSPIFIFDKGDAQIKKIFSMYKQRFAYILYDIENKNFTNFLTTTDNDENFDQSNTFQIYPWEYVSANGKILQIIEPLYQYVDSYGQTRLIEFNYNNLYFVGQFTPLPCLRLPIKPFEYFISVNAKLQPQQIQTITKTFPFIQLYRSTIETFETYTSPYYKFRNFKKLAEYILWAACHVYCVNSLETGISVDDWIINHTQVVENYTYSRVTIKPIFDLSELMINNKFIFNSLEFQNRIRYNLSLISSMKKKFYSSNIYHFFYNDITNFNVTYPAQLAMTKKEYFQRTREFYTLNILTTKNIKYLKTNVLYFIKNLFGYDFNKICLFGSSLDDLISTAYTFLNQIVTIDETIMNITVFEQETIHLYSIGQTEPSINIILINVNGTWFYGLIFPNLF